MGNEFHVFSLSDGAEDTASHYGGMQFTTSDAAPNHGHSQPIRKIRSPDYDVSPAHPIHILFPLPTESGRKEVNPFGITIDLARPVVDEAVDEVYRRQLVSPNSLAIHFEDSRLSDAHGPNVAINQLVDNRLDCIIGVFNNLTIP